MDRTSALVVELVKCAFIFMFASAGLLATEGVAKQWESVGKFWDSFWPIKVSLPLGVYRFAARVVGVVAATLGLWTLYRAVIAFVTTKP
jgi:hypothetical protein